MDKSQPENNNSNQKYASQIIESGKNLVALLRDLLLFVIALLLLFFPKKLNEILIKAGFEEGSVVGFKWKAGLAKSDLALKEAQATISSLRTQLDSISIVLVQAQNKINDPLLKEKLSKLEQGNNQLKSSSLKTQASLRGTISSNALLVKNAQEAVNENNAWGVVFSGDATLKTAQYEVNIVAPKLNIPNASIFYRQGSYRSVSIVDDREEAEQVLIKAKRRRADAYIVPMSKWCSGSIQKEGYVECTALSQK